MPDPRSLAETFEDPRYANLRTRDKDPHLALAKLFREDRWRAHQVFFKHRHPETSCEAHREIVNLVHSQRARQGIEAFRGIGKSTLLEETAVLRKCFGEFRNMVILGASEGRAIDRLAAIKREFEINPFITELFGVQKADPWQATKLVFTDSSCIQAVGRGQSMAGMKHLDWRPDALLVDDLEDPNEIRSDPERMQTFKWFRETVIPALADPVSSWVRVLGTRRGVGSLPERIETELGWPVAKFPLYYIGDDGEKVPTWPLSTRFGADKIPAIEALYRGDRHTFMQEYMCQAVSQTDRDFSSAMIRVEPRQRVWEAVYGFIDPASTVNRGSATTGWAVWSWDRNRLVVWDAGADRLLPDQIVALAYRLIDEYDPIWLGVERDGLNQFLMQPLRQEQIKRGYGIVPLKPVRAIEGTRGHGKLTFVRGLQPFFAAGEVTFAKPLDELEKQLTSFPYGPIDAPNALAYALMLRPGQLVYEGFGVEHIADTLRPDPNRPVWLACNATQGMTTAAALQIAYGRTMILADWALEAEPAEAIPLILREVGMNLRVHPVACCPEEHFDRYRNTGLVQTLSHVPVEVERGSSPQRGRELLRGDLQKLARSGPAVAVAASARQTLRALAGGYSRAIGRNGLAADEAEAGMYRLLMEGIEACLGRMAVADSLDEGHNWKITADGRRYMTYGQAQARAR